MTVESQHSQTVALIYDLNIVSMHKMLYTSTLNLNGWKECQGEGVMSHNRPTIAMGRELWLITSSLSMAVVC